MSVSKKATPLASKELQVSIMECVQRCSKAKLVKRGANEVTKSLHRGQAKIVLLAADATPIEILMHLPSLCEDKNVPYVFVSSREQMGRACGISREVIAASILTDDDNESLMNQVNNVIDEVDQLMV